MTEKVRLFRHNGAGSKDGYALAYRSLAGDRQLLRDGEDGSVVVFSKRDTHAAAYGRAGEFKRVYDAMHSPVWDRL